MDNMRVIRVTGKGSIQLKPDTTRLSITLRGTYQDYQETLSRSAQDTAALQELVAQLGLERQSLRTLSFDVDAKYESGPERGHNARQIFAGYEYTHLLKLEFPSDNELLGKVLYALSTSSLDPEFRLSYTVKDQEAAKNLLLFQAVADARAKARALAQAAEVELKEIQSIDYSWGDIAFEVQPMRRTLLKAEAAAAGPAGFDLAIEPEDIRVSDTVTVVWEIA